MLRLSPTKINQFNKCHKAYYWNYKCNLRLKQVARQLQVGGVVHDLSHWYQTGELSPEHIINLVEFVKQKYKDQINAIDIALEAAHLFRGFMNEYADEKLTFISSELPLSYIIEEWDVEMYGKPDAWARTEDGRLWKYETKTTSKFDSTYLNGLKKGLQSAFYDYLSEKLMNEKIHGTIYNLIVKTKIPQYHRAFSQKKQNMIDRMLACVEGTAAEIVQCEKTKKWYPSCTCLYYNRECDYQMLCEHDSKRVRDEFYMPYHEDVVEEGEEEQA